jgi:hypothetical protein
LSRYQQHYLLALAIVRFVLSEVADVHLAYPILVELDQG